MMPNWRGVWKMGNWKSHVPGAQMNQRHSKLPNEQHRKLRIKEMRACSRLLDQAKMGHPIWSGFAISLFALNVAQKFHPVLEFLPHLYARTQRLNPDAPVVLSCCKADLMSGDSDILLMRECQEECCRDAWCTLVTSQACWSSIAQQAASADNPNFGILWNQPGLCSVGALKKELYLRLSSTTQKAPLLCSVRPLANSIGASLAVCACAKVEVATDRASSCCRHSCQRACMQPQTEPESILLQSAVT
eukprot:1161854-Pelagomonas_calceolata.AAC.6